MAGSTSKLSPPKRVLMGPGPSDVPDSVLNAMALPTIGHLDPAFLQILDEVREMLRAVFLTENELTLPISGTGSAGMETCLANLIEPGDKVMVGVNGVFGTRMCEVASRCGAEVTAVEQEWGRTFAPDAFVSAAGGGAYKLLCIVHAETSTGVLQDMSDMRAVADGMGALLVADTVTSLAGVPVRVDDWGIDAVYSGTQKCLSCPPGLSPVSLSGRAVEALHGRAGAVQSWYLDLNMISQYWGEDRVYHHTAPINMIYGLHESLRLILEEGLEARWARHQANSNALTTGLETMGLAMVVPESERLPTLHAVWIPDGVDDGAVRRQLLAEYGLEIGGGLGPLKGRAWRIGLMGAASTRDNVLLCLSALHSVLIGQGFSVAADPCAAMEGV